MDNLSNAFALLALSTEPKAPALPASPSVDSPVLPPPIEVNPSEEEKTQEKKQETLEEQNTMNTTPVVVKRRRPVLTRAAKATSSGATSAQATVPATIDRLHALFESHSDPRIRLLRRRDVLQWLFEDMSFLPPIERKNKKQDTNALKPLEDRWGQGVVREIRPDLQLDKQWTNLFGEYLCQEIQVAFGKNPFIPVKTDGLRPDVETEDHMVEAKAGTYFTTGTAHEKIAGVFFKYADVPVLYGKPLIVVCLGGAERLARDQYGLLAGDKCTPQKQRILEFHRASGIEVVGATELLRRVME